MKKTGTQKLNEICKKILELSDEDFKEVENMANEQKNYIHPLKHATQAKYNELGEFNLKVISVVKKLVNTLSSHSVK